MEDEHSCHSIEDEEPNFLASSTVDLVSRDGEIELKKLAGKSSKKKKQKTQFTIPTVVVTDTSDNEEDEEPQTEDTDTGTSPPGILRLRRRRSDLSDDGNRRGPRRSAVLSLYMAPASGFQKEFLKSIKRKRVLEVEKSLLEHPGENLHLFTDNFGVSALRQAVETGTPEIVDVLLNRCTSDDEKLEVIHHAILFAIHDNLPDMVNHLLNRREDVRQDERQGSHTSSHTVRCFETQSAFEDPEYSDKLSPIVLAAQLERHEIIDLLMDRNCASSIHPLTVPCKKKTGCKFCTDRKMFKGMRTLEQSEELLEIYRALSSPAYMWKTELEDPIHEAFHLSGEMDGLKHEDTPFKEEYEQISRKSRFFARDMLALCRNSEEVMTLLSRRSTTDKQAFETKFPMVIEALRFNQREFIAHPKCQSILQKEWYGGLPVLPVEFLSRFQYHFLFFILYFVAWTIALPVLCVLYIFRVCKPLMDHMKHPIGRFLSDTASFLIFLMLIIIDVSMTAQTRNVPSKLPSAVQWMIMLWVLGMTFRYMTVLFRKGGQVCSGGNVLWMQDGSQEWSFYVFLMLVAFLAYIFLRLIGTIMDKARDDDTPRYEMDMFHPLLLSECAYSVGCILAFTRLNALFKASSAMGPLQISLRRMAWDIVRFMLIFFIVITAFVIGITKLYSAYAGYVRYEEYADSGDRLKRFEQPDCVLNGQRFLCVEQPEELTTLMNTYKTLFWSLFGYGDHEYADMLVKGDNVSLESSSGHRVSELTGYTMLGAYHVVAIIVLLNMLIAMMANSYNIIEANADVEWRFARTRLRMSYFNEVGALPPPFNLVPGKAIRWLVRVIRQKCGSGKTLNIPRREQENSTKKVASDPSPYEALMQTLIKRYWLQRKKQEKTGFVGQDEFRKLLREVEARLSLGTDTESTV